MAKGTPKHIHQFVRVSTTHLLVWRCKFPRCRFAAYPAQENVLVLGNSSLCWSCGREFTMESRAMKQDNPICGSCDPDVMGIHQGLVEKGVSNESLEEYLARREKEAKNKPVVKDEIEVYEPSGDE